MNHKKGGLENRRGGVGGDGGGVGGVGGGSRGGGETLEQRRRVIDPEKGSNEQLDGRAGPVQRAARPAAAPRRRPQVSPLFTTQHRSNSPSATPLLGILGVGRFLETASFWLATENCEDTTDSKHLT